MPAFSKCPPQLRLRSLSHSSSDSSPRLPPDNSIDSQYSESHSTGGFITTPTLWPGYVRSGYKLDEQQFTYVPPSPSKLTVSTQQPRNSRPPPYEPTTSSQCFSKYQLLRQILEQAQRRNQGIFNQPQVNSDSSAGDGEKYQVHVDYANQSSDSPARYLPPPYHSGIHWDTIERCLHFISKCCGMQKIRWVFGAAGVGKSAIMQHVADYPGLPVTYHASIFFTTHGFSDGTKAIPTLSDQFAVKSDLYRRVIQHEVTRDPSLLWQSSMRVQFHKFILEPFIYNRELNSAGRILIIIDGLDECNDLHTQEELLGLIHDFCVTYPSSPLVWLISSRPKTNIVLFFSRPEVTPTYEKEEIRVYSDEARANTVERSLPEDIISGMPQTNKALTWLSNTLRNKVKRKALFELRDHNAQSLIDRLNHYLSDPEFRRAAEPWLIKHAVIALRKLCEVSMLYPTCYVLSGVQDICPKSGGGFAEISQGRYEGQLICLKIVRLYQKSKIEDLLRAHAREPILWSQLDHPNIAPFHGIFYLERKERICLVSPWMENGDIVEYLERVPEAPRKPFVYDIANGLRYLHDQNIVHGDLKGHNVLIDDHRNACLADFGLSTIITNETLGFAKTTVSVSGHTTRWASPELLEDDARPTHESDVWAFGCVCYEVLTGLSPFAKCTDIQALSKLIKGELPAQLDNAKLDSNKYVNDMLCELVEECWSIEAKQRPGCSEILRRLENSHGPRFGSSTTQRNPSQSQFMLRNSGLNDALSTSTLTNLNRTRKVLYVVDDEVPEEHLRSKTKLKKVRFV